MFIMIKCQYAQTQTFTIKYDIHVLCTELNNGPSVEKGQKNYKYVRVNSKFYLLSLFGSRSKI